MIKRVTDTDSLSGVNSPLFPLVYTDFKYPQSESDGVFFQEADNKRTFLLSLKGGSLTCIRLSDEIDIDELYAFISFWNVKNIISDFPIEHLELQKRVLMEYKPEKVRSSNIHMLSSFSGLGDYKSVFELISSEADSFDVWFPIFSRKINRGNALGVYILEDSVPVSAAIAPYVYNDTAVVAGVFTRREYRNQGFASKCMKTLLNECNEKNIQRVYLWCENEKIKFYENIGFAQCGEIFEKKEE